MSAAETAWIRLAMISEFGESRRLVRRAGDVEVLLLRAGTEILAIENRCTHLGHPLDGGRVMAGQINCPLHGACFDMRTGAAISGPAVTGLRRFAVRVEDANILVLI